MYSTDSSPSSPNPKKFGREAFPTFKKNTFHNTQRHLANLVACRHVEALPSPSLSFPSFRIWAPTQHLGSELGQRSAIISSPGVCPWELTHGLEIHILSSQLKAFNKKYQQSFCMHSASSVASLPSLSQFKWESTPTAAETPPELISFEIQQTNPQLGGAPPKTNNKPGIWSLNTKHCLTTTP